jgi:chemotaxis regulatin CheY-phosphate phosphatase CheZ
MPDDPTKLNETNISEPEPDRAELAHSIIESLLEHTRVVSDLIAVMAQALDQDTTKALTLTAQWQSYLESRRELEHTRKDVEKFVELLKRPEET